MTQDEPPFQIQSLFHPSDFSVPSDVAFAHALKIALTGKLELTIFHVLQTETECDWDAFPAVQETLKRWGFTQGERPGGLDELGIEVQKVAVRGSDVEDGMLDYLEQRPTDLMVLSTRNHAGLLGWAKKRVAAPVARRAGSMALFVPEGCSGFVSPADGSVSLHTIVIPVDQTPSPEVAIEAVEAAIRGLVEGPVRVVLTHVGSQANMPEVRRPRAEDWTVTQDVRRGEVVEEILASAAEQEAGLIVMTTAGHRGLLEALLGSTSERVIARARCPVLTIPEFWAPGDRILNA